MGEYIWLVAVMNGAVCWLLLQGAGRLCAVAIPWYKYLWGAGLTGLYGGACLLTGFHFLGNWYWRAVFLGLTVLLVFGTGQLCAGGVFVLLELIFSMVTQEKGGALLLAIGGVFLLYRLSRRGGGGACVPVELCHEQKRISIRALRDTGNTLVDPVTGQQVLVVGAQVAGELLGLSREQLRRPVEAMKELPGFRLIPYKTIDRQGAMLLAKRIGDVRIGNWRGSRLVAFAPENMNDGYQALTGGSIC